MDFDGVLHSYERGWHDGTIYGDWVPGAAPALRALMERYAVAIHTTRDAGQVAAWLAERGFPVRTDDSERTFWDERGVLLITNRKVAAVAYIDDRAVRFETWPDALRAVGVEPAQLTNGEN
ncbi:hypothetical protein D7231_31770 [Streptomyces klenkii]|uniref:HAD family hydrolase n=1 Tax=Streptomyces klenkii TaxID=1420899 RepID=A0A3B0AMS3_9ACTN|nr:hypothetical protein D7231_31770 [Streptomyces klenkii]